MNNDFLYPSWAMLATDYYDLRPDQHQPTYLLQLKLNGVRARWHHIEKKFISRDGKVFPQRIMSHLYEQILTLKPTYSCDGEFYSNGLSFQTIAGMVTPNRNDADENVHNIGYYIFDIIDHDALAITRQDRLRTMERTTHCLTTGAELLVHTKDDAKAHLSNAVTLGYEGIILRAPYAPYELGRSRNLLKMKPLHILAVAITGMIEGRGKFKDMLGALQVSYTTDDNMLVRFKIGGGLITTQDRADIWKNRKSLQGKLITIQFSEKSLDQKPLKAQIANAKEFYV